MQSFAIAGSCVFNRYAAYGVTRNPLSLALCGGWTGLVVESPCSQNGVTLSSSLPVLRTLLPLVVFRILVCMGYDRVYGRVGTL